MSDTSAPRGTRPPPPRPRIARPIETFLADAAPHGARACDVLVVGSGYGGSFAALELAADHRSVWVFERGREFGPGAFAETLGELPGHVQFTSGASGVPRGYRDALFDIRVDDDAVALVGCGLGGGSLINAGVFLEPRDAVLDDPRWPRAVREDRTGLRAAYDWARTVIGVAPFERPERFPKYVALRRLARAIPNAGISAAPIAVAAHDGDNAVGVPRRACIECGNCVTGCNHEAKNTLPANAIPLAAERGARFWTGARAVRITRAPSGSRIPGSGAPARWRVHFERIATLGPGRDAPDTFEVLANVVVLAAGALGSAELLLRSASDDLPMPATLGARFSGNGDLLSFGWGQRTPVHAAARPDDGADGATGHRPGDRPRVGPTIVGVVATRGDDSMPGSLPRDAVLQEGAVPAGLAPMIGTLLSAAGTVQSMTHPGVPSQRAWARGGDPIAVRDDLADRCQVLLAMGRDRADGRLGLDAPDAAGRRRFRFGLGYARDDETIAGIEAALEHAGSANGFDDGFHLPNPAWRPLPAAAEAIFGKVDGRLVTVHPIGGCVMGDDRAAGAVDDLGRVYDPAAADPRAVHDGLHVLDGAILPTALGVNPMATIAAVSIRASRRIAAMLDAESAARPEAAPQAGLWPVRLRPAAPPAPPDEAIAGVAPPAVRPPPPAHLRFAEALLTEPCTPVPVAGMEALLDAVQPPLAGGTAAALGRGDARLALQVTAQIDPWRWVADPARPWTGEAVLSVVDARGAPPGGIERIVGRGTCTLHLLRADPPANVLALASRLLGSALAFNARRPGAGFFGQLWKRFCELGAVAVYDDLKVFLRTLRMHTTHRRLDYSATLRTGDGGTLTLAGGKRLAYTGDERNVWDALLRIDLTPSHGGRTGASWPMRVDLLELLSRGPYQLLRTPDTPTAVAAMSAVGALWLRALVQTHFWSFRGPDDTAPDLRPPSGKALSTLTLPDGTTVAPVEHWFDVRRTETSPERLRLRLSRFRATGRTRRGAMLFVHGLAHGGEVYTTSSVERPMAARFVDDGWDVWVLDHRLSNLLGPTPRLASTIDDVATCDLPGAFDAVESLLSAEGTPAAEGLRVFAHCVGAAALSIAILSGRLTRQDGRSRISALVMHAVHPWTVPSRWNRVSASLGAFYRDVVGDEVLDPLPGSPPGPMDQVIDRLAASIPWSGSAQTMHLEDAARRGEDPSHHDHYGDLICNRMTLFYGREWDHDNLDPRTHARLHELVGPAHISVFKHLFYILRRQRLTDSQGRNAYLSQAALDRHWTFPTLYATGMANGVFDPASAARSFLAMSLLRRTATRIGRCGLFLPPGIGHMDFLFGRHNGAPPPTAGKTSLPGAGLQSTLSDFVADPEGWLDRREASYGPEDRRRAVALSPQLEVEATPWAGPLLRYTLGPAHFELEAWIELRPFRSARVEPGAGSDWLHQRLGPGLPGDFRRLSWSCEIGPDGLPPEIPHPYVDTGVDLDPNGELQAFRAAGAAPDLLELSSAYMRRRVDIPDTWSAAPWLRHLFALRAAGEGPRAMTFLLGSCRWPGLAFERDAAAAPIAAMNARVARAAHEAAHEAAHDAPAIDGLLLLGDQVYVDATADLFDTGIPEERASQRYREAFSGESLADERLPSPEMAQLLSSLPSWMVVDDHEFGDDWPGWSPGVALSPRFREGFDAALAYQWRGLDGGMAASAHAPASSAPAPIARPALDTDRVKRGLWHPFEAATLRCFALDTRTERQRRSAADWQTARIMHPAQHAALADWLRIRTGGDASAPRLLLCGSPLGLPRADELDAATPNALRADDWHGYPTSCRELLQAVLEGDGAPVVLLCGDPHYSCVVELEVEGTVGGLPRHARLHLVVASGLNTTLPFANGHPRELARGRVRLPFSDATLTAHARLLGGVATTPRHFTQLGVRCDAPGQWSLEVEQVDERGATITRQTVTLGEACAEAVA